MERCVAAVPCYAFTRVRAISISSRNRLGRPMNRICLGAVLAMLPIGSRSARAQDRDLALVGGTVYASPTAPALPDATVLVHGKTIAAVGKSSEIALPKSARVIACAGKVITAGFWNSHVHFETGWANAQEMAAAQLEAHMQEMLTRWGF